MSGRGDGVRVVLVKGRAEWGEKEERVVEARKLLLSES